MTIERARQILGNDIADLSDQEVGQFLKRTSALCSALLDLAIHDIVNFKPAPRSVRYEQNSRYLRSRERPVACR